MDVGIQASPRAGVEERKSDPPPRGTAGLGSGAPAAFAVARPAAATSPPAPPQLTAAANSQRRGDIAAVSVGAPPLPVPAPSPTTDWADMAPQDVAKRLGVVLGDVQRLLDDVTSDTGRLQDELMDATEGLAALNDALETDRAEWQSPLLLEVTNGSTGILQSTVYLTLRHCSRLAQLVCSLVLKLGRNNDARAVLLDMNAVNLMVSLMSTYGDAVVAREGVSCVEVLCFDWCAH